MFINRHLSSRRFSPLSHQDTGCVVIEAEGYLFAVTYSANSCSLDTVGFHSASAHEHIRLTLDDVLVLDRATARGVPRTPGNRVLEAHAELIATAMCGPPRARELAAQHLRAVAEACATTKEATQALVDGQRPRDEDPIKAGMIARREAAEALLRAVNPEAAAMSNPGMFAMELPEAIAAEARASARWQEQLRLDRRHGQRTPFWGRVVAGAIS